MRRAGCTLWFVVLALAVVLCMLCLYAYAALTYTAPRTPAPSPSTSAVPAMPADRVHDASVVSRSQGRSPVPTPAIPPAGAHRAASAPTHDVLVGVMEYANHMATYQPPTPTPTATVEASPTASPMTAAADPSSDREVASTAGGRLAVGGLPAPWDELAECESGTTPTRDSGNGYYGLFQFLPSTWRAMGGTGLPSDASVAEQLHRAQQLQAQSGWDQWPYCANQLGLL